jgi:hypothetical protein
VTAKKELIKINRHKNDNRHVGARIPLRDGMNFAFATAPKFGVRTQVTAVTSCREILCDRFGNSFRIDDEPKIDTEKMRLLVIGVLGADKEEHKEKLFSGKAALNLLESINKWPESKIATVNHEIYEDAWLITGPKEWISCPQMLSIATWILRLCAKYGPAETENLEDFKKWLDNIAEQRPRDSYGYVHSDISTDLEFIKDKLFTLIESYDEVFAPFSMESVWRIEDAYHNFGIESGFRTFLSSKPHTREARLAQKIFDDILIKKGFELTTSNKEEKKEEEEVEPTLQVETTVADSNFYTVDGTFTYALSA